jgi:hypothetical protein
VKKGINKALAWMCALGVLSSYALTGVFSAAGVSGDSMAVREVSALKGVAAGTNLRSTAYIGADGGDRVSDFTMTAVKPLALDVTGARLNAASAYYQDWANAFSTSTIKILSLNVGQSTSGFTGILLYVGLPETGNAGNELWFQAVDSVASAWVALKAAAPVYLLGTDGKWSQIAPSYHGGSYTVGLPDGFKGYINLPFDSFAKPFDTLSRLQFAIQGMGGANGGVDFGPLFMTANNLRTKERACIDGETDGGNSVFRSLFTGALIVPPAPPVPPEVLSARQASALSGAVAGADLRGSAFNIEGKDTELAANNLTLTAAQPFTALNVMGARLNSAAVIHQDWTSGYTSGKMLSLNVGQPTEGATGILLYIRLPDTAYAANELWFQAYDATVPAWIPLKSQAPVYLLRKNGKWSQSAPVARVGYQVLSLPDGFEGYINIPFDSFSKHFDTLSRLQFSIQNMGGENGGAYFGPFFLTGNNLRTGDSAWLDGETDDGNNPVIRNLFAGELTPDPDPPEPPDNPPEPPDNPPEPPAPPRALAANLESALNGVAEGTDLRGSAVSAEGRDEELTPGNFTMTAGRPLPGLNAVGVKLDSVTAIRQDWTGGYTTGKMLSLNVGRSTAGSTGILVYVRLPETGNDSNELWLQAVDSDAPVWVPLKAASPVHLLGTDGEWSQITPSARASYQVLSLPDGFEGYINIPFDSFSKPFNTLTKVQFSIQNMGGENGSAYFGPFFMTANNLRTRDGAWIDKETDADGSPVLRSLFDGRVLRESDIQPSNKPPELGSVVSELPPSTLNEDFIYEVLSLTSVQVFWPLTEGASFYRLDLYVSQLSEWDGIEYSYIGGGSADTGALTLTGLDESVIYYAVIHAFGENGSAGTYRVNMIVIDADYVFTDDGVYPMAPGGAEGEGDAALPVTGRALPASALLIPALAVCATVLSAGKRRGVSAAEQTRPPDPKGEAL